MAVAKRRKQGNEQGAKSKATLAVIGLLVAVAIAIATVIGCEDYVCWRDLKTELEQEKYVPLLSPEDELRSECVQAVGVSKSNVIGIIARGQLDDRARVALHEPACLGWAHYRLTAFCNAQIAGRRRNCSLYDDDNVEKIGDAVMAEVVGDRDVDWENDRINGITKRLLEHTTKHCFPGTIRIGVINDDEVNAMAFPNGRILMHSSLLMENDATVAYVLAHELSHILWNSFDGALLAIVAKKRSLLQRLLAKKDVLFSACRGPMDEVFVDRQGIRMAEAAGYDPTAAVTFILELAEARPDPTSSYRLTDSHPPPKMRATLAALAALEALNTRRWRSFIYYRGTSFLHVWDGEMPNDRVLNECKAKSTDCGNSDANIPAAIDEQDWSEFECTRSKDRASCLGRSAYSKTKGRGCPGSELCCAPAE